MNEPFPSVAATGEHSNIILVATDAAARTRALNGFEAAFIDPDEVHLMSDVGVDRLAGRSVWIEVGEDRGEQLDRWLMAFDAHAKASDRPASLAMTVPMVDIVSARIDGRVEMLIAPDTLERASAIAQLFMRATYSSALYETRGYDDSRKLRQLSDEVARIAAVLSRISSSDGGYEPSVEGAPSPIAPEVLREPIPVSADQVRGAIRARRMREKYFPADYFADPAWDMLLDLFAAELGEHRVPVSSLCIAAAVPATTALRWMKTLTDAGVFVRRSDPHDGRRIFVELSQDASSAMRRYFSQLDGRTTA